jgi:primosomal protein N' (replication factor Y) (superfamily II helicase)
LDTPSLWEEFDEVDVVDVVVDIDAPDLQPTYTYRVPEHLRLQLELGACVHVPFGGQEKLGYVLDRRKIAASDPLTRRLRDVIGLVEGAVTFSPEQAATARWMADRYVCDLPSAVRCVAPAAMSAKVLVRVRLADPNITADAAGGALVQAHILETLRSLGGETDLEHLRNAAKASAFTGSYAALLRKKLIVEEREVSRPRTVTRTLRAYELGESSGNGTTKHSPAGERILTALSEFALNGETPVLPERLLTAAQASSGALKTLVEKGAVRQTAIAMRRNPHAALREKTSPPELTAGQAAATEHLANTIASGRPETALLFGVTASGKTEVYLDAIAHTLAADRSAIVLLPEIALTTQVVEIFTGRFGDEVAVLHSRLSEGERHDEWRRLQERHARIAVGARSAVFAPVENVGLIVVDEEHEASYKQETTPRYHARDVAIERACLNGASVLLGSATPSIETYYASEQGHIARLEMPERIDNRPLPSVHVIDLREEFREHKSLFGRELLEAMGDRLSRGQQTILFLNRRGYAQFVLCRDCGYVARCPYCAVSLAYHAAWGALKCHHCGYGRNAPSICPSCQGPRIKGFGIGTERVEEEVLKHFPSARVARLDRDTTSRKGAHQGILGQFRSGQADILIGTQMVAKGLDFPNVTLVGVISADTSINMPDFRAAERTFQLLTQVAGRAGRGVHLGDVYIQTFSPEHYSVQKATQQDYPGFYAKEIEFREELLYPPFSRFANVISTDEDKGAARTRAEAFAVACKSALPPEIKLLGPAPAPLSKLKGHYRWHVVLRAPVNAPLSTLVRGALGRLSTAERLGLTVDVDPSSMA